MPKGMSRPSDRAPARDQRAVLIVDDHPVTRLGLATLVDRQRDLAVCGEAGGAQAAMELLEGLVPDLTVVDLANGTMGGVELLRGLKAVRPRMRVLVLSSGDEEIYAERALRAGASGYIMMVRPVEDVLAAMRLVLAGEVYLSDKVKSRMLNRLAGATAGGAVSPMDSLTDRELEVFRLIGKGYGTRQIAASLHLSSKTIESHREHLKRKLGLAGGSDLARHAIEWARSG